MSELYKTMPDFVPKPYTWGELNNKEAKIYFFLSEFVNMTNKDPEPNQLCSKLARLHRDSVSPTGMLGFHITTCLGNTPQEVAWESSWVVFFSKLLKHVVGRDAQINGAWKDLDTLSQRVLKHAIPQVLEPLEAEGRKLKPCLIHADLWEGNTGTSIETGNIYIFDSGAFYEHNEMEIGDWRCSYNKIHDKVYTNTYLRHFERSEPKYQWDDRNRLYSIYYNVIYSANHTTAAIAGRQM